MKVGAACVRLMTNWKVPPTLPAAQALASAVMLNHTRQLMVGPGVGGVVAQTFEFIASRRRAALTFIKMNLFMRSQRWQS